MTATMKCCSVLLLAAGLCLAPPLGAQQRAPGGARGAAPYANPSAAIAAELAMAKDSRERGHWAALLAAAAPEAILFEPQMVWARQWLRGRSGAAGGTREPHEVWSSCDGSLVASRGAWQRDGTAGRFITIWQRQPDGTYRWLLEQGTTLAQPPAAPDMIAARVADCPDRPRRADGGPKKAKAVKASELPPLDPAGRSGAALDGSLDWVASITPDGAHRLMLRWHHNGGTETILDETLPG